MVVGAHLFSKRPKAAEASEFAFFNVVYRNLTFQSRCCSSAIGCLFCQSHLGEDYDEDIVIQRGHGTHVVIVCRCGNPGCREDVFHLSCLRDLVQVRVIALYAIFPELYQVYRRHQFVTGEEIIEKVKEAGLLMCHWSCPMNSNCGLNKIHIIDCHGFTARSLFPPPQSVTYLSKFTPVPRAPGPPGSHLLPGVSLKESEHYHWTAVFCEAKKRVGFLNLLLSLGNELIDESVEQYWLMSVQMCNYPPGFPHNFIDPSLLIVNSAN
jgi:hypothetical protein